MPDAGVAEVFATYPPAIRKKLLRVRKLIFATAAALDGVGPITETLKWGEPAYLTERSRSGSTIRLGWKQASPHQYAIYFNCNTGLVDTFRTLFPELSFVSNRALVFDQSDKLPVDSVSKCIALALTYHRDKRKRGKLTPKARRARTRANR